MLLLDGRALFGFLALAYFLLLLLLLGFNRHAVRRFHFSLRTLRLWLRLWLLFLDLGLPRFLDLGGLRLLWFLFAGFAPVGFASARITKDVAVLVALPNSFA